MVWNTKKTEFQQIGEFLPSPLKFQNLDWLSYFNEILYKKLLLFHIKFLLKQMMKWKYFLQLGTPFLKYEFIFRFRFNFVWINSFTAYITVQFIVKFKDLLLRSFIRRFLVNMRVFYGVLNILEYFLLNILSFFWGGPHWEMIWGVPRIWS